MLNTFATSFRLQNTYRVNAIIYNMRSFPLIGKKVPTTLYKKMGIKTFAAVLSAIKEVIGIFLGKLIYCLIMILGASSLFHIITSDAFLHIAFILSGLAGYGGKTHLVPSLKSGYYAIFILRMDPRKYTLSNFGYYLLTTFVGFLPVAYVISRVMNAPSNAWLLLPFYVVAVKILSAALTLHAHAKDAPVPSTSRQLITLAVVYSTGLLAAYGLPVLGYTLPYTVAIGITVFFAISALVGLRYILSYHHFRSYARKHLSIEALDYQGDSSLIIQDTYRDMISLEVTSDKSGYAFFHELFVKRHTKVLAKPVKRQSLIIIGLFIAALVALYQFPEKHQTVNLMILNSVNLLVFIMHLFNVGQTTNQAMFMNCDHSMLTYRFYRNPKVILMLFVERLKTMIVMNLIPATILGVGLALLLLATGGAPHVYTYALLIFTTLTLSTFFSIHFLTLYYLLQPYNIHLKSVNSSYGIATGITAIASYSINRIPLSLNTFGWMVIGFSALYASVALFLVYRLAPKTFKLRP